VEQIGYLSLTSRIQHRHGSEWVTLVEKVPEPAEEEGLRWNTDRVFVCPKCQEEVRILGTDAEAPAGA